MRIKTLQQLIEEGYTITESEDQGWFLLDNGYRGQFNWLGTDASLHQDEGGFWRTEDDWYIDGALLFLHVGDLVKAGRYQGILTAIDDKRTALCYCVTYWDGSSLDTNWFDSVVIIKGGE